MTDRLSTTGLYYLPIDRIDEPEFAPLRDGRQVLAGFEEFNDFGDMFFQVLSWDALAECWKDAYGDGRLEPTHFFPGVLSPIGDDHVSIECGVIRVWDGKLAVRGLHGRSAQDVSGHDCAIQTVTVRVPTPKIPHGD